MLVLGRDSLSHLSSLAEQKERPAGNDDGYLLIGQLLLFSLLMNCIVRSCISTLTSTIKDVFYEVCDLFKETFSFSYYAVLVSPNYSVLSIEQF